MIDEWDPINLLPHAPDDEYDAEIRDIVKILSTVKSIDELALGIHEVSVKWFGENSFDAKNYSVEKYYPIAVKIRDKIFS